MPSRLQITVRQILSSYVWGIGKFEFEINYQHTIWAPENKLVEDAGSGAKETNSTHKIQLE
jgi:hypothetical protein